MKTVIAVFALCILCLATGAEGQSCKVESMVLSDAKLSELASLPVGLSVSHSPEVALATWNGNEELKCKWSYKTTVASLAEDVTVEEFGCFSWNGTRWVFRNVTGAPFTPKDFSEWYNCPGAKLTAGDKFHDPSNWTATCSLQAGKSRWYFIGKDSSGNRVKGEATVKLAAEYSDSTQ